jgi:hypothetical protein
MRDPLGAVASTQGERRGPLMIKKNQRSRTPPRKQGGPRWPPREGSEMLRTSCTFSWNGQSPDVPRARVDVPPNTDTEGDQRRSQRLTGINKPCSGRLETDSGLSIAGRIGLNVLHAAGFLPSRETDVLQGSAGRSSRDQA